MELFSACLGLRPWHCRRIKSSQKICDKDGTRAPRVRHSCRTQDEMPSASNCHALVDGRQKDSVLALSSSSLRTSAGHGAGRQSGQCAFTEFTLMDEVSALPVLCLSMDCAAQSTPYTGVSLIQLGRSGAYSPYTTKFAALLHVTSNSTYGMMAPCGSACCSGSMRSTGQGTLKGSCLCGPGEEHFHPQGPLTLEVVHTDSICKVSDVL